MVMTLDEAAASNDVHTLFQLIEQDPTLLDRASWNTEDKNALHIAVLQGNVAFLQAILQFRASYYLCFARDREGRNPLHLAAIHGKLEVLQVLVAEVFQAALEKADGGGTILHLCVKFNQLDALRFLSSALKDPHLANSANEDGMTILHLAVWYHNKQIAKFLLDHTKVGVNAKNASGKTALDLLLVQGDIDRDILSSLEEAKALEGNKVRSSPDWNTRQQHEWYERSRDWIMVVASLIATMAFQAGVSPPGGVWSENFSGSQKAHKVGEAVMAQTHPTYYGYLIRANTVAFVSSLSIIVLLFHGSGVPSKHLVSILGAMMWLSITGTAVTYAISLAMVAPEAHRGCLSLAGDIVVIVLMVWSGWMFTTAYELYTLRKRRLELRIMVDSGCDKQC